MEKYFIHAKRPTEMLLIINCIIAFVYYLWWFDIRHIGNILLYTALFLGETYHVGMSLLFWFTVWPHKKKKNPQKNISFHPSVDIFIPVTGEPVEVIQETILAAKNQAYQDKKIYILNDGYVAKKDNWQEVEKLAKQLEVGCITRKISGGAKAGNINNALRNTDGEIIVIFDADMTPFQNFLETLLPYFQDIHVGFVQSPQYYKNHQQNDITRGSWEQQEFFFGPIMRGKDNYNSAFICGTNVAIRRSALEEVGGMEESNIAEDFLTSLFIHKNGWKSRYIPDVLAVGLAPQDMLAYTKQQYRWARGSLEVLFAKNPLFWNGLTIGQKLQYLSSALYYLNGLIVLIDSTIPLFFLFFGIRPVTSSTVAFAFFFIPFIFVNLFTLYIISDQTITFRAFSFSQSLFPTQLAALKSVLLREKSTFTVTPKKGRKGNFIFLIFPHLLYGCLVACGLVFAIHRYGFLNPSVITNSAWAIVNILLFWPFVSIGFQNNQHDEKNTNFASSSRLRKIKVLKQAEVT